MSDSEFGIDKQKLLIEYMLSEEEVFQRSSNILKPAYFDVTLQSTVSYLLEHSNEFHALPTIKQIKVETGYQLDLLDETRKQDIDWALASIEQFCKRQAIVQAVWESTEHIENSDYGTVEQIIKEAMAVTLQKDLGTDYFENPRERLERMRLTSLIPMGWIDLDRKLYGGLNKGELTIFAAGSGVGKSLFLQNIALNWIEGPSYEYAGTVTKHEPMNVIYISFELSEELVSKRLDTMITGIDARDIFKRLDDVELKVVMFGKKTGNLRIKYMSPGTDTNDLKAFLKEHEIQTGQKIDGVAVDYLDLMNPISKKINPGDLFIKDKYVTEELRSMAAELNILLITASQLNRSAVDEADHSQAMIAGGISKINTADNVVSIYSSAGMKERGEYQCQFLKTRSSSGVGQKVYLAFDTITLRITNAEEGYRDSEDVGGTLRETAAAAESVNIIKEIKKPRSVLDTKTSTPKNIGQSNAPPSQEIITSRLKKLKEMQERGDL